MTDIIDMIDSSQSHGFAMQILYKDSEHVDSAVAEPDASTTTDDGGAPCCIQLHSVVF